MRCIHPDRLIARLDIAIVGDVFFRSDDVQFPVRNQVLLVANF